MNKLIIIGRLTRDPEHRLTATGIDICNFTVAVDRKTKSEEKNADFFKVVAFKKLAEICADYLKKGKLVMIEGSVKFGEYQTDAGEKRTKVEVIAENMQMLSKNEKPENEKLEEPTLAF